MINKTVNRQTKKSEAQPAYLRVKIQQSHREIRDNASLNVVPIAKNTDEFTAKQDAADFFFLHPTQGNCHNHEDFSNTLEKDATKRFVVTRKFKMNS